jgi:hypothetical protein
VTRYPTIDTNISPVRRSYVTGQSKFDGYPPGSNPKRGLLIEFR